MSTNHYAIIKHASDKIHVGKSSASWVYALRVFPDGVNFGPKGRIKIRNLEDWMELFLDPRVHVINEYNHRISVFNMIKIIAKRPRWERKKRTAGAYEFYDEEVGLWRMRPGMYGVIANGPGTWDLHDDYFR